MLTALVAAVVLAALHLVSTACGSDRPTGNDALAAASDASADSDAEAGDEGDGGGDATADAHVPIVPMPIVPLLRAVR